MYRLSIIVLSRQMACGPGMAKDFCSQAAFPSQCHLEADYALYILTKRTGFSRKFPRSRTVVVYRFELAVAS
ncbi:MAG: hypothetical protein DMF60_06300 [Acidobacteria bacterium]|nr:MAG: hypothetical protein DMF60_06300 [Acidobacteriota bacterium]